MNMIWRGSCSRQPLPPPYLSEELVTEILVRLPARFLLQLRSVCRSWKALISSPEFASKHLHRSITDPTITASPPQLLCISQLKVGNISSCSIQSLLNNPSTPTRVTSLGMMGYYILGHCNGLVCLYKMPPKTSDLFFTIRLWNPCTRVASDCVLVELLPEFPDDVYCGFGHDRDKYKFVIGLRGRYRGNNHETVTRVLTFGSNSDWRTVNKNPPPFVTFEFVGRFVSGSLNWIGAEITDVQDHPNWAILSFDLEKETFSTICLPDKDYDLNHLPVVQILRGCLSVCFPSTTDHMERVANEGVWS